MDFLYEVIIMPWEIRAGLLSSSFPSIQHRMASVAPGRAAFKVKNRSPPRQCDITFEPGAKSCLEDVSCVVLMFY